MTGWAEVVLGFRIARLFHSAWERAKDYFWPEDKWVEDVAYLEASGLRRTYETGGCDIRWCLDEDLPRRTGEEGWKIVKVKNAKGKDVSLRLRIGDISRTAIYKMKGQD